MSNSPPLGQNFVSNHPLCCPVGGGEGGATHYNSYHSPLQVIQLRDRTLAPSSCTFETLRKGGLIKEYSAFKQELDDTTVQAVVDDDVEAGDESVVSIIRDVMKNTLPENEEYPQVLCTTIVARATNLLNESMKTLTYRFSMKPVVKRENDARANKHSDRDLSILRITNGRTLVIIECKLSVSTVIVNDKKILDDISQLFLEATYTHESEMNCEKLLLSLTDAITWHFFVLDMTRMPLLVTKIHDEQIAVRDVIRQLLYYIQSQL